MKSGDPFETKPGERHVTQRLSTGGTRESAPLLAAERLEGTEAGGGDVREAGLDAQNWAFNSCSGKLGRGSGLTLAHEVGISETGGRARPGTQAAKRAREAPGCEPEPRVQTPREAGPSSPAAEHRGFPPTHTPFSYRTRRRSGSSRVRGSSGHSGRERPPARQRPKPGRGGRKREPNTRGSAAASGRGNRKSPSPARLPLGARARLARPPPPSPDAPKAPPACERKQNTNHLQRHRLLRRHRPVTSPPQPPPLPPWA